MKIEVDGSLTYTTVSLTYRGKAITISHVLIDSVSESTVFSIDVVEPLGIRPESWDKLETIRGVGGREVVFIRIVDAVAVGECSVAQFRAEFGGMDYGFKINGILGMDFLLPAKAVIDFGALEIRFQNSGS